MSENNSDPNLSSDNESINHKNTIQSLNINAKKTKKKETKLRININELTPRSSRKSENLSSKLFDSIQNVFEPNMIN